jgi:hypothetical protein
LWETYKNRPVPTGTSDKTAALARTTLEEWK